MTTPTNDDDRLAARRARHKRYRDAHPDRVSAARRAYRDSVRARRALDPPAPPPPVEPGATLKTAKAAGWYSSLAGRKEKEGDRAAATAAGRPPDWEDEAL